MTPLRRRVPRNRAFCLHLRSAAFLVAAFLSVTRIAGAQGPADSDVTLYPSDSPLIYDTNLGLVERATNAAVEEALSGLKLEPGTEIRLHSLTAHEASWFVEDVIARFLSDRGYKIHLEPKVAKTAMPAGTGSGTPADGSGSSGSLADALNQARGSQPDAADSTAAEPAPGDTAKKEDSDDSATGGDDSTPAPGPKHPPAKPAPAGPAVKQAPPEPDPSEIIPIPEGEGLVLTFRLVQFGVTYHDSWRRGFMGPRVVERLASVNLFCRLVSGSAESIEWVGQGKSERLDIVPQTKLDLLEGMSYPFKKPEIRQRPLTRFLEPVLVSSIIGGLVYLFYTNQE